MLVRLDLLVGLHNTQVHSRQVDLSGVLLVAVADKCEVRAEELRRLLDVLLLTGLVVEQTELEGRLCARLIHAVFLTAQVEDVHQVADGLWDSIRLRVGLSQQLMSFDLLGQVARLLAKVKELLASLHC